MTQFKDKAARSELGSATVGLFSYPILQAADILAYQADEVPVGADQSQHVELTRDLAQRFNSRFGSVFTVPQPTVLAQTARIADLQDPSRKMSKSLPPAGQILVMDPPEVIVKKVRRAVTDTGSEVRAAPDKPGVSNLLSILAAVTDRPVASWEAEFAGRGYGALKAAVADALVAELAPVRTRYTALLADPGQVHEAVARGAQRAGAVAAQTVRAAKQAVGFLPPAGAGSW